MSFTEQVGALKRALHRALSRRLSADTKLSLSQLWALRVIARREVRTQAELSARLSIDAPAASRLVDRLEKDALLRRAAGSDRRSVHLKVTAAAREPLAVLESALEWLDAEIEQHLSPREIATATRLLAKLREGLLEEKAAAGSD